MNKRVNIVRFVAAFGLVASFAAGRAQGPAAQAESGRKVAESVGPAVITIRLVKKNTSSYEGQSSTRESNSEIPGVIIDGSGLAVTSLVGADPAAMFAGAAGDGMSSRSEITDARYVMADGEEIPAKVVLRDKDFDLMFLRPVTKPGSPMRHLDLRKAAKVQLLDPVIVFSRLGKLANRALGARIANVQGVVEKPRLRYIISAEEGNEFGSPVMALNGEIVGLFVVRVGRMSTDAMDSARGYGDGILPVVLTAADVLKAAVQAPEDAAKGPAPAKAPTKSTTIKPKNRK